MRYEMPCAEYDHDAVVARTSSGLMWTKRPEKVHVATEALIASDAAALITGTYDLTPGCRDGLLHGDLRDKADE